MPLAEYPRAVGFSSRLVTMLSVSETPSRRAVSMTLRTRSGRAAAFAGRLFLAVETVAFSVPALISDRTARTTTKFFFAVGAGTDETLVFPDRMSCLTCFIGGGLGLQS